ncbi:MAG: hypothetical protein ABWY54_07080 [Glaciihabitans sp.]
MSLHPPIGNKSAHPKHGASTGIDPYLPGIGNGGYRVDSYDIDLDVKISGGRVDGLVVISAVATQPLSRFSLDLAGLVASKVSVNGSRAAKFSQDGGTLTIRPSRPLGEGQAFTVMVQYGGFPHPIAPARGMPGGGWAERQDGVSVSGYPVGASTWFPCDERADDRATVVLRCACDAAFIVVASGVGASPVQRGGRARWLFTQAEPVSVGTIGLQIGRFGTGLVSPAVPGLRLLTDSGQESDLRYVLDEQERTLGILEALLGRLPHPAVTTVVRGEPHDPLFSHSLLTLSRGDVEPGRRFERLIVRALAFQWFGASLAPALLSDAWLSTGFVRYVEWLWSERRGGGATADELARQYYGEIAAAPRDLRLTNPGPDRVSDDRIGGRGALALHALRLTVGDDAFFTLLRGWADTHAGRAVTTESFLAYAESSAVGSGPAIRGLLEPWLAGEDLPALPAALG